MLLVRSVTWVNEALLASCPRLGFVGTATIGTDHIDQGLLAARGILLSSAPAANKVSVGTTCSPPCWFWRNAMRLTLSEMSLAPSSAPATPARAYRQGRGADEGAALRPAPWP